MSEGDPRKILVVDDEENIRDTIRIHLEREGYGVLTSEDGRDAVKTLKTNDVSLIITDIKMPRLNGFGLLDYARENYSYIPVVMLTGYIDVDMAVDAMKKGTFHYLTKPVKKRDLISVVEDALTKAQSVREMESFRISQVYLLAEGGKVIFHKDLASPSRFDSDIYGSMLTAVSMFIDDSFEKSGSEEKAFEHGDSKILIEEGNGVFLVAIGEGRGTSSVRKMMKRDLKGIERRFGHVIGSWNGDVDEFEGVETELAGLLDWGKATNGKAQQPTEDQSGTSESQSEDQK